MDIHLDFELLAILAGAITALTTIILGVKRGAKAVVTGLSRVVLDAINVQDIKDFRPFAKYVSTHRRQLDGIDEVLTNIRRDIQNTVIDTKRLELLCLVYHTPARAGAIEQAFAEYIKLGGNSYIHQVIEEWRKEYGGKIIRRELKRADTKPPKD